MGWLPFRNSPFLDHETERWQLDIWAWFLRQLGGIGDLRRVRCVLPTRQFFSPTDAQGHARAEHILREVMSHARMSDWPCRLVEQARRPELRVGDVTALRVVGNHSPAGTFGLSGNAAVITYDPGSIDDPMTLVATLAHELAHYRLSGIAEGPPGGEDAHEPATDLATVYLGFGLFGANSAFNFRQHQDAMSQGWSTSRLGYLTEREWVFALAVFLELRSGGAEPLAPYLKAHLTSDLKTALRYLNKRPELLAPLRGISSD
jgi:hypothetical protein